MKRLFLTTEQDDLLAKKNLLFKTVGTIRYPHARMRIRERQIQSQKERERHAQREPATHPTIYLHWVRYNVRDKTVKLLAEIFIVFCFTKIS